MPLPMSRFGTVPMTLLRIPGEQAPEWRPDVKSKTFHFPGGNATFTQAMGRADLTVDYLARLDSAADLERLVALANTRQVLRVPFATTAFPGTRAFSEHGELYKEFDRVFLVNVLDIRMRIDGSVLVTCAFSRESP